MQAKIHRIAREKFGFQSLRPGQAEAIEAVLQGRDTLVVQPTGSGKSAIYQIAGLLIHGATVVISPLIALQKDQVDSIAGQDLALAVAVNSTRPATEARENFDRVAEGEALLGDADREATDQVDQRDDDGGDRVAADEFRRTIHRTEEICLLRSPQPAAMMPA